MREREREVVVVVVVTCEEERKWKEERRPRDGKSLKLGDFCARKLEQ